MSDTTFTDFAQITYDRAAVARQGWGMASSGPKDDGLIVGFYKRSMINPVRSREAGKPVYEGKDFVKIQHPGETQNIVDRPIQDSDKHRWPHQWHLYQQGANQTPDGVPLSLLFPAKPEIESTLRGYNIHTVEQLANLSAHGISTVGMGAQEWVNSAKKYMEQANKGVNHHQHEKDLADRDAKIATLSRQIAELTALVNARNSQAPAPNAQTYDFQTAQINQVHASADETQAVLQGPAQFVQDLSGSVEPVKRRGRPPGSRNKEH